MPAQGIQVLTRLSRSGRYRAGWMAALIYLLCVLAPSSAFAFGNARLSEHCLFDDSAVAGLTYQPDTASSEARAHSRDHEPVSHHAEAMHHHHRSMQVMTSQCPQRRTTAITTRRSISNAAECCALRPCRLR